MRIGDLLTCTSVVSLICAVTVVAAAQEDPGEARYSFFDEGGDLRLDIVGIEQGDDGGELAADWSLQLAREFSPFEADESDWRSDSYVDSTFTSTGFVVVTSDTNDRNQIKQEFKLDMSIGLLSGAQPPRRPRPTDISESDGDIEMPDEIPDVSTINDDLIVSAHVLANWETTQNFENNDVNVGGGLGVETSLLHWLLDLPFSIMRVDQGRGSNNGPTFLNAELSYEYVSRVQRSGSERFAGALNDSHRLSLDTYWSTGLFKRDRIQFFYTLKHELNPSDGIKDAGQKTNHFFQTRLTRRLTEIVDAPLDLAIIYTMGELSPVFNRGHTIGAGISAVF